MKFEVGDIVSWPKQEDRQLGKVVSITHEAVWVLWGVGDHIYLYVSGGHLTEINIELLRHHRL